MLKKLVILIAALGLVAAACGGSSDTAESDTDTAPSSTEATTSSDDTPDETTSTTAAAPASDTDADQDDDATASNASGAGSEYCQRAEEDSTFEGFDVFSDDLESEVDELLSIMAEAEANAPAEIRDDVSLLFGAFRDLAEILAEYDYDLFAIPPDDPRFTELDTPELEQASRNIAEFCGIDPDAGFDDGGVVGGSDAGALGSDDLPDGFPDALVPPGLEGVDNNGAAGLVLGSSASYDEVLAHYVDLLGDPSVEDGSSATFTGEVDGQTVFVNIVAADEITIVTILSI